MRKLCLGLSVAAMVLLCACGDETTTNVTETTGLSVIAKGDKIPSCSADIEGKMIYVAFMWRIPQRRSSVPMASGRV